MGAFIDLIGQRFGRLVVERLRGITDNKAFWICLCDCGNHHVARTGCLRAGTVRSCGCLELERRKIFKGILTKHGMSRHPLSWVWADMMKRCYDSRVHNFKYYGGAGVVVCDLWKNSREDFYNWALVNGYRRGLWLDRIILGPSPYAPDNCRFVTPLESGRHVSSNVLIKFDGAIKTVSEWSGIVGVNQSTIYHRLKRGWSPDEALSFKAEKKPRSRRSKQYADPNQAA